jgi:hypothetical protein
MIAADRVSRASKAGRPHPQPLAAAYLEFDLTREIEQLHREPAWAA